MAAIVSRDMRTVTGRNIRTVEHESGCDAWTDSTHKVRKAMMQKEMVPVPEEDGWRLKYLDKLLERRQREFYLAVDTEEVQGLIDSLCVS